MFKNYLKIAFRTFRTHKAHSLINVTGMAIGIACCLLIVLYVYDELRYDQYHENADRLYRVVLDTRVAGENIHGPVTPAPMAKTLLDDFPSITHAARLYKPGADYKVEYEDRLFNESRLFFADSSIFDVFTIPLVLGDPGSALVEPNTVVITESTALKYFGEKNPLDEILVANNMDFRVTGVAEDPPSYTHFHFDFIASFHTLSESQRPDWFPLNYLTYIVLQEGSTAGDVEAVFPEMVRTYMGPEIELLMGKTYEEAVADGDYFKFYLQSAPDVHLYSNLTGEIETNGDIAYIYLFSIIALLILVIACVNFMNLSTARSAGRAKEVGMRKVLGSLRKQLIQQFLMESVLQSVIALAIGIVLLVVLLPFFNNLAGKQLDLQFLLQPAVCLTLLGFAVGIGLAAGSYPALFLSSFRPVVVLKGRLSAGIKSKGLRNGLVVFQFATSIALIVGTIVVFKQLQFVQNTRLGFDKEQVVVINRAEALGSQRESFKDAILQHSGVIQAAASGRRLGSGFGANIYKKPADTQTYAWRYIAVDADFAETLLLEMVDGRDFDPGYSTDSSAVLVNEAAAGMLGWDDVIDRNLERPSSSSETINHPVLGIVRNFHFESLHHEITPLVIHFQSDNFSRARYMYVRVRPDQMPETIAYLKTNWNTFTPNAPFDYSFLDQDYNNLYQAERRTGTTFGVFSVLGILIACLGLFGLATFTTEQRTKEIGVRKTLGASVSSIVVLLTRDFALLVGIAFILAVPLSYIVMSKWLEGFAYRIDISLSLFLLAGIIAFLIAFLTISYQTIKAAVRNPIRSLRYE